MFDGWPFMATFVALFCIVMARANATYWLGRVARHGGERTRAARHLDRPVVRRAESLVASVGAPAVTLSFLTVGIQSAVNFAAGVLRMPLVRYEAAVVVGSLAWAGIYTTIGFAVVESLLGAAGLAWWLAAAGAAALVVLLTRAVRRRLRPPRVVGAEPPQQPS